MGFVQPKLNPRFAKAQYLVQACRDGEDVFKRCKIVVHAFGPVKKSEIWVDSIWVSDREYKIKDRLLVIGGRGKNNKAGIVFNCKNKETGQASSIFIVGSGIYYLRNGKKKLEMYVTQMSYFSILDKKFIRIKYE